MIVLALVIAALYPIELLSCHDGDTCKVDIVLEDQDIDLGLGVVRHTRTLLKAQYIRLCDIDAPELGTKAGPKSRDVLLGWLREAKSLQVQLTGERDKYGRWLGYLLADGVNLNVRLRNNSLAVDYNARCK